MRLRNLLDILAFDQKVDRRVSRKLLDQHFFLDHVGRQQAEVNEVSIDRVKPLARFGEQIKRRLQPIAGFGVVAIHGRLCRLDERLFEEDFVVAGKMMHVPRDQLEHDPARAEREEVLHEVVVELKFCAEVVVRRQVRRVVPLAQNRFESLAKQSLANVGVTLERAGHNDGSLIPRPLSPPGRNHVVRRCRQEIQLAAKVVDRLVRPMPARHEPGHRDQSRMKRDGKTVEQRVRLVVAEVRRKILKRVGRDQNDNFVVGHNLEAETRLSRGKKITVRSESERARSILEGHASSNG